MFSFLLTPLYLIISTLESLGLMTPTKIHDILVFTQVIYGVPMQSDMTATPQHYILMAEDSHGQIASEILQVLVSSNVLWRRRGKWVVSGQDY